MNRRHLLFGAISLASPLFPAWSASTDTNWDAQYDVIVVGSGFAGLAAAIEAAKSKASVLLIEKMDAFGGNSAICAGDVAVPNSPVQHRCGIFGDSPAVMAADLRRVGGSNDLEHIRTVCEGALPAWQWTVEELGVSWITDRIQFDLGQTFARGIMLPERSGSIIVQAEIDAASRLHAEMLPACSLQKILLNENGAVIGIEALKNYVFPQKDSGDKVRLRARRGVVLATGGFSADIDFRKKLDPRLGEHLSTSNQPGATGEALRAALGIGAKAVDLKQIQVMSWNSSEEIFLGQSWTYIEYVTLPFGLWISRKHGKLLVSPGTSHQERSRILIDAFNKGDQCIAIIPQRVALKTGFDQNEIRSLIKQGIIHQYASLEAFATDFEVPMIPLEQTVESRYSYKEPADQEWYAILLSPKVHHCMGGLSIDSHARVRKHDGTGVIPRLYAAGEVTGGLFGRARLPSHSSIDALVMGRIAGQSAAMPPL